MTQPEAISRPRRSTSSAGRQPPPAPRARTRTRTRAEQPTRTERRRLIADSMSKLCTADRSGQPHQLEPASVSSMAARPLRSRSLEATAREKRADCETSELIHLHTSGKADYAKPGVRASSFRVANLFVGHNMRKQPRRRIVIDYLPCFLVGDPGSSFVRGSRALDVALVQVSPPDRRGYCSLGVSVDVARAAVDSARKSSSHR